MSVREAHLLPTIDNWLSQVFDDDPIDDTIRSLASTELDAAEELQARGTIKECDKRINNFEIALDHTNDPDTIAGFTRRIERARAKPKTAEISCHAPRRGGVNEAAVSWYCF